MSSAKPVAEYAKSGRSSCKGCGKSIAAGSLRLGLVNRDPRGFDATKWHHLECFRPQSGVGNVDDGIQGFHSLQDADKEALRKIDFSQLVEEPAGMVYKRNDNEVEDSSNTKKQKFGIGTEESMKESSDEPEKVAAEYAKSGRSSCKDCGKPISLGALRLALVSRDRRGFDMTKWYHSNCFHAPSGLLGSVDEIQGFSSLKDFDQETLKKLVFLEPANATKKFDFAQEADQKVSGKLDFSVEKGDPIRKLSEGEIFFSSSDIRNMYKDASLSPKWKAFQTVIFNEMEVGPHDSERIAAFDFDGCLVNTSVKRIGPDAWSLMYPTIPEKLQKLYEDGYKLVIFTNESNIERWKNKRQQAVDSKIGRLDGFSKLAKVPMQVFIACGLEKGKDHTIDPFRKPKDGMWRLMAKHFNSGIAIDIDQSFYVGDAAGRINDHSDADIKFAQAIGLKFYVADEYFAS